MGDGEFVRSIKHHGGWGLNNLSDEFSFYSNQLRNRPEVKHLTSEEHAKADEMDKKHLLRILSDTIDFPDGVYKITRYYSEGESKYMDIEEVPEEERDLYA